MHIFRHIFLSNYWWQKTDIWSQASYRAPISWEAFLYPSDSYFLFADFVDFYTHSMYLIMIEHISRRAPDKLRICVFYAMKTSENACIIRSACTHYAYILLCKQTFQIRIVLVQSCMNARHFGTRTLRHLCETFRHQDSLAPGQFGTCVFFFDFTYKTSNYGNTIFLFANSKNGYFWFEQSVTYNVFSA